MFDVGGKFQDLIFILFSQASNLNSYGGSSTRIHQSKRANDAKYSGWNWEQGIFVSKLI